MGLTLAQMLVAMQVELEIDDSGAIFSDALLTRGVVKSVALMSRQIPKIAITEHRLERKITGETLTIASNTGTTSFKPIRVGTLKIPDKKENTDYSVNHMTGVVTEIGALLPDADYTIAYELDPQILDLSTFLTDYMRIERIEYPAGLTPPNLVKAGDIFESFMFFNDDINLTTNEIIRITYRTVWAEPGASAGDYPPSLDTPIIIGAIGQALISKAELYTQTAKSEIDLANAAADSMATPLAAIATALGKVALYLETNGTTDNANDVLSNITDNIANLRTRIYAALDTHSTYVTGATNPSAKQYLDDGDAYLLATTDADQVPQKHAQYAQMALSLYKSLVEEAVVRLNALRSYIEEAGGWSDIAKTFIAEGSQRIVEVNSWAIQAGVYSSNSVNYLNLAGRYLASGQAKINEMLIMLGLKPEYNMYKSSAGQFE